MAAIDQPFKMSAGQDAEITVTVKDMNKAAVNLTGYTVIWHLCTSRTGSVVCEKTVENGGITIPPQTGNALGTMKITLVPADTQDENGIYWHECWITSPKKVPVCHGQVTIEGSTIS